MTAQLINQDLIEGSITYDRVISRYRFSDLTPVVGAVLIRIINEERRALAADLELLAAQVIRGLMALSIFEASALDLIKAAGIRVMTLAAGGQDNMLRSPSRNRFPRQLRNSLESTLQSIQSISAALLLGSLTEGQFRERVRRLSLELFPIFSRAEIIRLTTEQGYNQARRSLDPTAKHCPQCPGYSTNGRWIPIFEIVPIGHWCFCGGHCHCRIDYRFNPQLPRVSPADLDSFVVSSTLRFVA